MYTLSRTFSLLDPELTIDPYPIYKSLRTEAPVYWDEQLQAWLVSRYADVKSLLSDSRLTTSMLPPPADDPEQKPRRQIWEMLSKTTYSSPTAKSHSHLRRLAEKAFTFKVSSMEAQIQQIVDSLLDSVEEAGRTDIAKDISAPLPAHILSGLLSVPLAEGENLKNWGFSMLKLFESPKTTKEEDKQALQVLQAVNSYAQRLVEQRLQKPKDDMISVMAAEENSEDPELKGALIQAVVLLLGGSALAIYPITTCMLMLLRHPHQMSKLIDNPKLIDYAIDETIRYEGPLHWAKRRATKDIELHGQLIRQDQIVLIGLASANRDETKFSKPDQFDLIPRENHHLAFGHGPHYCLGAPLFRLQAQIAINTILHRFKKIRLETSNQQWVNTISTRGLETLPVTFNI